MNESSNEPMVLLLDLSGNERAAREWANQHFRNQQIQLINKADLKWGSKREALASVRAIAPHTFAIFTNDLDLQSARCSMILFGALAGARCIVIGDRFGRAVTRTRLSALLWETPRLGFEFLFGYAVMVPLSWLLTLMLSALLRFRDITRRLNNHSQPTGSRPHRTPNNQNQGVAKEEITSSPLHLFTSSPPLPHSSIPLLPVPVTQSALYIRATLTSATEGGMATHVAGFTSGAQSLGHRLQFLVSSQPQIEAAQVDNSCYAIKPSATLSATRAIFELWNNLLFTAKSICWLKHEANEKFDFIYQRYSRFNWTGVALSIATGLPLALEFNGSEVWVSQSWDPVGQAALLKRFERLNQRAADFIFTVSEVERRNVIGAGVDAKKIFTNPNGVDTDQFRSACGGREIRKQLGIEDKIVVGFLGTFGPWHGAPVLAKAATQVKSPCHFLFIGDGDERATTAAMLAQEKDRATFTGRIAHEDVAAYLDVCDILVAPLVPASDGSEFFGSPTKLFEYLAMERPVIASRLGQIADIIIDGENGYLVEPNDAGSLAQTIEKLANDERLRRRLGLAARRTVVENYTWQHNAARVFNKRIDENWRNDEPANDSQ
jgi:glycosyltransferase involved in cell wall biosynthesis